MACQRSVLFEPHIDEFWEARKTTFQTINNFRSQRIPHFPVVFAQLLNASGAQTDAPKLSTLFAFSRV